MDLDPMLLPPPMRGMMYTQMELPKIVPLECPQQAYVDMIDEGGLHCPMDGIAFTFSRELTDFVLRNHELFSSAVDLPLGNIRPLIPLNIDPPQHSKYRRILDPLFAPKKMDAAEHDIAERANFFIDKFIERGECNFTEDFAELFPSAVFLGLMGLPWEELDTLVGLRNGILHPERVNPDAEADIMARFTVMNETGQGIYDYFNRQLDAREAEPTDDILMHFITTEIDGDRRTREEILDLCYLFLIAGLDTVSDSLTCMFAFLVNNPERRQQIVDDPDIIASAVEEMLRWESPVPYGIPRVATTDVELPNGTTIPEGTAVSISYGAANVDPAAFADAFEVRFDREANRHIAFGGGAHRCLGSHLARRELRVALAEWHRRIPNYQLKPGHEDLHYASGLRHVEDLTLVWS
jgi:cytochrome P450